MRKVILLMHLLLLYPILSGGQALQEGGIGPYEAQMPGVLYPSPQAMAYMRYGDIPVSLSTGVPEITVPIYTLQANGLEIPINISYHASGIKVNDIASTVGLGWVLNAGGMIAQTVYGWPDAPYNGSHYDLDNLFFTSASDAYQKLNEEYNRNRNLGPYATDIKMNWYECITGYGAFLSGSVHSSVPRNTISDRFTFNFNGNYGAFRYDMTNRKYEIIPHSPFKVELTTPSITPTSGFIITDDRGIKWTFSPLGQTMMTAASLYLFSAKEYYLTSIQFPGLSDKVVFNYTNDKSYLWTDVSESVFSGTRPSKKSIPYEDILFDDISEIKITNERRISDQQFSSTSVLLKSIEWKDVSVNFSYASDRKDIMKDRLTRIEVKSGNTVVRTANLTHTPPSDRSKMLLKEIEVNDEKYAFKYFLDENFPLFIYERDGMNFSEDFWGYYNSATSNKIVPFEWKVTSPYTQEKYYLNHREANPVTSMTGMLTEIIYPTKGKTVFEYEQNKGKNVFRGMKPNEPEIDFFGGVRIKKITNHDNSGKVSWKSYKYEGGPTVTITPDHFCDRKQIFYMLVIPERTSPEVQPIDGGYPADIGSTGTGYPFTEYGGSTAFYHKVTEYFGDSYSLVNHGKIEYTFTRDTVHPSECSYGGKPQFASLLFNCDQGVITPLLVSKKEFTFDGSLKRETLNSYRKEIKGGFLTGVSVRHDLEFVPALNAWDDFIHSYFLHLYYRGFSFYDIRGIKDIMLPDSTKTTEYTSAGSISTVTSYTYDGSLRVLTPVATTVTGSVADESYREAVTHPFNHSGSVYSAMSGKNILSPVISKKKYKINNTGTTLLATIQNDYRQAGDLFVIDNISTAKGIDQPEERIRFHKYDAYGNPVHVTKDGTDEVVYLWGYRGQYPVAEIKNSTYNAVNTVLGPPENLSTSTSSNMTLIDGLRNSLPEAHITTFTYRPLTGIASATDPRNLKTSYDYDGFGRLKAVKDNYSRTMQAYDYNYANDAVTFSVPSQSPPCEVKILNVSSIYQLRLKPVTVTYTAEITGQGNFKYHWQLKDAAGNVLSELRDTSSDQFTVTLDQFGTMTVVCAILDSATGQMAEESRQFVMALTPVIE